MGNSSSSSSAAARRRSRSHSQYLIQVSSEYPYFVWCFRRPLHLTLVLHNKQILDLLQQTIVGRWPVGLKKLVAAGADGTAELQLSDQYFCSSADLLNCWRPELLFNFVRLICFALNDLNDNGWRLALATDTWTRYPSLSTMIFRKLQPDEPRQQSRIFAVSMSFDGNVLLVNATEPAKRIFLDAVRRCYSPGVLETVNYGADARLRLAASPWTSWPVDRSVRAARRLLLNSFRRFQRNACRFYSYLNTADFGDCLLFEDCSQPSDNDHKNDQHDDQGGDDRSQCCGGGDGDGDGYAALTFANENQLHVMLEGTSADKLLEMIKSAVVAYWHLGLKEILRCVDDDGSYDITLNGSPFGVPNANDSTDESPRVDECSWQSRYFQCNLFQSLAARGGWRILASFNAHRKSYDSATYILRQCDDRLVVQHRCLAFDGPNLVRLVNDQDGELTELLRQTLDATWSRGVKRQRAVDDVRGYEFQLSGQPWTTCVEGLHVSTLDGIAAQTFVCLLVSALRNRDWTVSASAATYGLTLNRGRQKQRPAADSWILTKISPATATAAPAKI